MKKHQPNERLRYARELRGWGQKDVAEKLGLLEDRAIRRWETGESLPSPYYRQRLCDLFEMNALELGFLGTVPSRLETSLQEVPLGKAAAPLPGVLQDKNRQRLLKKVHAFWIAGVLDHSLQEAVLLRLGLEERPEALANPWQLALQHPNLPPHPLPPDTTIETVYEQAYGEVLILGEPGSGKTTLLLTLTRHLLERATEDETHPMPVVFHLSSWAAKRQYLASWLVEELHEKYQVPHALGQTWVANGHILPFLDGLDEVAPTFRTACIEAINAYIPEHTAPLVVCSRRADYFAQHARLHLNTAVVVQPLTPEQIDAYLGQMKDHLSAIRSAIQQDLVLQELVQTPLMLSILILSFQGHAIEQLLPTTSSLERQQRHLFSVYVERMLERRGSTTRHAPQQTKYWLAWLARRLKEHSQTVFYVESMQPDWLPEGWPPQLYQSLVVRLWAGLVIGMIYGFRVGLSIAIQSTISLGLLSCLDIAFTFALVGGVVIGPWSFLLDWLLAKRLPPLASRVLSGLLGGLLGGLVSGWLVYQVFLFLPPFGIPSKPGPSGATIPLLFAAPMVLSNSIIGLVGVFERRPAKSVPFWSWRNARKTVQEALLIGLIGGIAVQALLQGLYFLAKHHTFGVILKENNQVFLDTSLLILNIALYALPTVLLSSSIEQAIQPVEMVVWSWKRARQGIFYGVSLGLIFGILLSLFVIGDHTVTFAVFFLLFGCFFGVVLGGISGGVSKNILEERVRVRPNQLIWRSARNGVRAGAISGLICAVFLVLISVGTVILFHHLNELVGDVLSSLLVGVLLGGLIGGIWVGGLACLQHALLRLLLWRTKRAPWNYPRFLNYAAERILLQKVGGGYVFIHRLLLDHFAGLDISIATQMEDPSSD